MNTISSPISPRFNWEAPDLVEEWPTFIQHVGFLIKGPLSSINEEEHCNYLMIWIGDKRRDIHSTWNLSEDDSKNFSVIKEKFENHVKPKSNRVYSRYKFLSRTQREGEIFEKFLTDLRLLVKECGYKDPDDMIRDAIVFGTKYHKVREKCINEGSDLTLEKAINFARTSELSKQQVQSMEDKSVHGISVKANRGQTQYRKQIFHAKNESESTKQKVKDCRNCGKTHDYKQCHAYGETCRKYGKLNHFAVKCR
ncbi:uncharacterized protein LOC125660191 [Ostrea edulis]|uniref:uncharacterized protein LOC125660191 n=1 Tax=Ostrea edulis TaxID=37623 RepID=UPI0024AF5E69|nr:uncharacterized protein LOC125660191 [Ostrea edulis]